MRERLATSRPALSKASRNPLAVAGVAIVLGILVAGVHFWSESFVPGWTSFTTFTVTHGSPQEAPRTNDLCEPGTVPTGASCETRRLLPDGSYRHLEYFPAMAPICPEGFYPSSRLNGRAGVPGRSDECYKPTFEQGTVEHPPEFSRPPNLGDLQFAATTALVVYFLLVGFILSGRALRGTAAAGESGRALRGPAAAVPTLSHSVAQAPSQRKESRLNRPTKAAVILALIIGISTIFVRADWVYSAPVNAVFWLIVFVILFNLVAFGWGKVRHET